MKADFKDITNITIGDIFYLYGNYKKSFEVFCCFIREKFQKQSIDIKLHFYSVSECLKVMNGQCDLFGSKINCFCIKGVEDSHLEKISQLFVDHNSIFILDNGNYLKSKKTTDYFLKDKKVLAIASFNNDITLYSLCRMLFPDVTIGVHAEIVRIINGTDEELYSIFKKISCLLDSNNLDALKNCAGFKQSFLCDLDLIPLIRFLLQAAIKQNIFEKSLNFPGFTHLNKGSIHSLLAAELKQKSGIEVCKSYIFDMCSVESIS